MIDLSYMIGKWVNPKDSDHYVIVSLIVDLQTVEYNYRNFNLVQRVLLDDTWLPKYPNYTSGENCGGVITSKEVSYYDIQVDNRENEIKIEEKKLKTTLRLHNPKRLHGTVLLRFYEEECGTDSDRITQDVCFRTVKTCIDGSKEMCISQAKFVKSSHVNSRYLNTKTVSPIDNQRISDARESERIA